MKIQEYQAKQIFQQSGIAVPKGRVADSPEGAALITLEIGAPVAVKAQVLTGGRGKAGGVRIAQNPEQAQEAASQILGMNLKGLVVQRVLVEEALPILKEYYLGVTVDRSARCNTILLSQMGGIDIEEVAAANPEKIIRLPVESDLGLTDFKLRQGCLDASFPKEILFKLIPLLKTLYHCYISLDANLAEINPLIQTPEGHLLAADAKINLDENALYRHPELETLRFESEEDPLEAEAHRRGLQYVRLDGDIGVIGNGAGLVMATLDEVKRAGGSPANFLDIGGGAKAELVRNALEMVVGNPAVRGILINVFGGITRGDEVARGIIEATQKMNIHIPVVVRLTGTNETEGRALLSQSSLFSVESMQEGAQRIVDLLKEPGR